ncbi:alpha-2-macroglobulin-like protein 1 [Ascaphus truei]|uniref:alpha-2-macroglobulin-like protein 1 n=1 Tax=Ascaphus truei TaxID=8439 RepID=UPI003F5ABB14
MLPHGLCVGLILLQLLGALEADLHYAVIVASEIRLPEPELACLHLWGVEGESSVQLILHMSTKNITLIDKSFQQDTVSTCVTFQVPPPSEGNEEVATLEVSIESGGQAINSSSKVLVKRERSNILIQTDKSVYKPGQTVKFRVVSLKENLQPDNVQFPVIELQDPGKNRIGQWLNVSLQQGIADLSLPLSSEPPLGEYSIRVKDTVHTFSVEEYVLPKFEVTLQFPKVVTVSEEHFTLKLCSRYTYGKPVQGEFTSAVCRKALNYYWMRRQYEEPIDLCVSFRGKLDKSGCYTEQVKTVTFNLNSRNGLSRDLVGTASITEEGTGIVLSTSSKTSISSVITKVTFVDADNSYKPGIPYSGTLKVVDASDSPLPDKVIYLTCSDPGSGTNQTLVTDENGRASFKLENTTHWVDSVNLRASTNLETHSYNYDYVSPEHTAGHLSLKPFYSRSKSFLKLHSMERTLPCEGKQEVRVEYIIPQKELEKDAKHLELHYLVTAKGTLQDYGNVEIPIKSEEDVLQGAVSLQLPLSVDDSPTLRALVYILLPDGELVADSAKFNVMRCFKNKVAVQFTPDEVLPGSDMSLRVQAAAGSLCALRVVDQSVVLMKPERELSADQVHNLFPFTDFGGYDYRVQDTNSCEHGHLHYHRRSFLPVRPMRPPRRPSRRSIIHPRFQQDDADVYSLFKATRLKIITSSDIKKPVTCWEPRVGLMVPQLTNRFTSMPMGGAAHPFMEPVDSQIPTLQEKAETVRTDFPEAETVRTYFPETWIWELTAVGESGSADLHHSAPDTITDWSAGAFCMGPSGFGLSSPASLRTFQPFFVELTLPYSVVRGETFTLKASVFNYLKQCIKVQATLKPSLELQEEPCADCQYSSCLCADESKTFYWSLTATKLGEVNITVQTEALDTRDLCHNEVPIVPKQGSIDTVIRPLLVQPGGVLEEKSHSSLLCSLEGEDPSKTEEISLKVPENILKDSERAHVTVLGDLMGTAMQNLDRLLAMPYGCGEQNMVLFAPNIFILQYLEKTQQLNREIQSKANKFLESGYQRQLTYKHDDGSYSAFGKNDPEGNTWLTAFVLKSFSKARPYIFIDESHLNHSISWLNQHREQSGCFRSVGKLFNNAMKGGVEDEVSLSAYVTVALLEAGVSLQDPLVKDAVSCLQKAALEVSSVYTQALLAYTFTLCGETRLRQSLLDKLDEKAVRSDGQLHWERKSLSPASDLPFWYRAPSVEVELTSYMLLTHLSGPEKDLGKASEIVNWLSKQQNPYGGFSSTQDTVVALQALAKYAEATFSDKGDVTIEVQSQARFVELFHVDNSNRLLLQRASLSDIPGEYTVTATGSGCVYVQTVLRYNVPPPKSDATFEVRVETAPKECPKDQQRNFEIHINAKYTGSREKSNMALIEVKMLSGYIPVKSSVRKLEKEKLIQRSDIKTDMVTLYLDELRHDSLHLSFLVEQDILVKNLKPATVKVYDYYETEENAIAEYNSPCSSDEKTENSQ